MAKGAISYTRRKEAKTTTFDTDYPDTVFAAVASLVGGTIEVKSIQRALSREELRHEWQCEVANGRTESSFEEWITGS